ncbi:hypothetical protein MICAF_40003 [Microcystis aeruginosa PCC 9807]|uniref:Uncharacterized protein n=1 Tax=Microcystis aeruginosa PCC 9807 TaxID=1160283 RepID=I4H8Z6_MICAE|nr:hypothetical protein [Microcystis aeruginosa]CCI18520.1 hypothetical protein MICAF_40003 [Microcystis aeruginosa PCC 9807]
MGVPVTFLSSNTRSALGSAITALIASETYLVVPWSDVSGALGLNPPAPDSLEDWLAAINYTLVDKVLADTNSQQAKITASRRFITQENGKGLESFFEPGTDLAAYQLTTTIYTVDSNPVRPPATNL